MWRWEDEKMWRWEDVKMRRCEDEKMWRWEDVMMRCEDEKMFYRPPLLEEPCAQTLSGKMVKAEGTRKSAARGQGTCWTAPGHTELWFYARMHAACVRLCICCCMIWKETENSKISAYMQCELVKQLQPKPSYLNLLDPFGGFAPFWSLHPRLLKVVKHHHMRKLPKNWQIKARFQFDVL